MRIGVARRDITPPEGADLTGFIARENPSLGVHDPLTATALAAEDGGRMAALVVCDLIGLGAATVRRVRQAVAAAGIPAAALMVACTHTHGGPATGVVTSLGDPDPVYLAALERTLIEVVVEAAARLEPARLGWARGECHAAHNRVLARAGGDDRRIDPAVVVVRIATADGAPLATLLHYTCHPVAAGHECRLATADWCGVARQQLEAAGAGPVLIVNGAGGDINPRMERRGLAAAEQTGRTVGAVALDLWRAAEPVPASGVAAAQARVPLAMEPPGDAAAIAALWARWRERAAEPPASLPYREAAIIYRDHARRLIEHHWGSQPLPSYTGETQALRLGPVAIVGLPGEFFSAYGLRVKAAAPEAPALIAGWTNDNLGYFPTAEGMAIGGYEPDIAPRYYGYLAPWSAAAGAAVTERAIELLRGVLAAPPHEGA